MNPPAGNKAEGAAPPPAAQQNAPAEKTAPHAQVAPQRATGQAPKADADAKAGAEMKGDMKARESAQKNDDKAGKSAASDKAERNSKMSNDEKAAHERSGKDDNKASAQRERGDHKDRTTGQGAASSRHANLSTEQRTKIRTVIHERVHVKPETHVNFSISVGTRVPRTVHYHTLPAEVVTIYPEWRGYYFVLVGDQIVVLDPSSFEIVAVIA
jgi:hypothetical protein